MVSIALRAYNNDIGDMIDHQQIKESISHCRHILETYPKYVDTYRLLGKAYLEEKLYGDASDILQRVLSSVPEDFIAHVGMSIIREDEGNLDAAIYHMERAFETQPSNHAIQDELRRLHASRDGMEPPRIRLTRGALARMYAHGHLYDQAIAELMAALSEDPQRFDLQTLLAEMYYQSGKKVDSAETCTKILEKLPYCLKANQLLTIILEENDRTEDAKRYRQRWESLEPYASFTDSIQQNPDLVPENQIKIERLQWEPDSYFEDQGDQPAWASSLGVSFARDESSQEEIPAWLEETVTRDEGLPGIEMESDEAEDDFFTRDTSGEFPLYDDDEAEPGPQDWLRETDEREDFGLFAEEEPSIKSEEDESFDFLGSLEADKAEPLPDFLTEDTSDEEDWMAEFAVPEDSDLPAAKDETLEMESDWLSSIASEDTLESPKTPVEEDEEEAWFASLSSGEAEAVESPAEPVQEESAGLGFFDSTPGFEEETEEEDWFATLGAEKETEEDLKEEEEEWLASLSPIDEEEASIPAQEEDQEGQDWFTSFDTAKEIEETEEEEEDWLASLPPLDSEEAAIPAAEEDQEWLASLSVEQEVEEEPEEVELPDFLKEAGWEKSSGDVDETGEIDFDFEDQLEEIEEAEIPDWIRDMAPTEDSPPVAPSTEFSAEADPEWLKAMDQQPAGPEPDWLSELDEDKPSKTEVTESKEPVIGQEIQADDLDMAWLETLATKYGVPDEELVTSPEQRAEVSEHHVPEGMMDDEDTELTVEDEDWLASLETQADTPDIAAESPEPVLEEEDDFDMDWLEEIGQEAAEEAAAASYEFDAVEAAVEPEEDAEDDWLAALADKEDETEADWLTELETPSTEDLQGQEEEAQAASPVLEDEDDFDMDWLDEIGKESAEEATATSFESDAAETAVEAEEDAEDDWLAALAEKEDEAEADWLTELETPSAEDLQEQEEETGAASPVLDEEDDFDMDWLEEIGQEAAEEAAATSFGSDAAGEAVEAGEDAGDDWLKGAADEPLEEPDEMVSGFDSQPDFVTPTDEESKPEESRAVYDDQDDFDTGWLKSIGQEAAEEAAATSIEPTPREEEDEVEEAQSGEATAAWLTAVGSEYAEEQENYDDTTGQFLSSLQETDEETPGDLNEFLSSLDRTEPEIEFEEEEQPPQAVIEEQAEELGIEQLAESELEEVVFTEEEVVFDDTESEAEGRLEEEAQETSEVLPTHTDEWQPETQAEQQATPEAPQAPAAPALDSPEAILESAGKAAEKGHLDEAILGFKKLVKKGKLVDEVIQEITDALRRHPVNVDLWQLLGDAYMRVDNLQEALDAYTNAEELLR